MGCTVDGCPAGIALTDADLLPDLERRKAGAAGTTTRTEADTPQLISGTYRGMTTGGPITVLFANTNTRPADYAPMLATFRPGHADFVLHHKHGGHNDPRGGGHSSGRLTVALVAAGCIAKKVLGNIAITAELIEAGGTADIEAAIAQAVAEQDSIGGIIACQVAGLPIGLGEPFFDSVESVISHAVFAVPAVKAIAFGSGFTAAGMKGSQHNDPIIDANGTTATNHAGGINGGITNGNGLYFTVAIKPTSSTPQPQQTWNNDTQSIAPFTALGRHDLCIALRAPVVIEAATAIALADLWLRLNSNSQ